MKSRMGYRDPYYVSDRERRKKRNLWIIFLTVLSVCFVSGGILGWYFTRHHEKSKKQNDHIPTPVCPKIPDEKKFDCLPDNPFNENECLRRGCCFAKPANTSFSSSPNAVNVPYCYYPSNYVGYKIKQIDKSSRRIKIQLQRTQPTGFSKDILNLEVLVSFIDDNSLRIKMTDADSERFQVPVQLYYQTEELKKPLYSVDVDEKSGLLSVFRVNTKSIIFQTNLFRLVYSDQFLQLSSNLSSPYVYGIGEHYESILRNVNWTRLTLFNSDLSPTPKHGLYGSHPFYMSLEKDGKANGVFLLNSNIMDIILQPAPAVTFRPIGGIFDFFIMLGPSPKDVAQQYSDIVGKTFMPPYWSLGFHLCRYGYKSLNKTKETMYRTIKAEIPLDVQWNDIDYMDSFKDFTYDKVNFKGLPEFVDDLHSKGRHYIMIIDPGLSNVEKSYAPYDEGLDDDIFVKNANGSLFIGKVWTDGTTVYPDFSHPAAVAFWTRQFKRYYDEVKFDGVWIDMNEPSNFFNGEKDGCPDSSFEKPQYIPGGNLLSTKTLCMTAKHYYTTHYNEHNLYAYREAIATNKAIRSVVKKRPFIISRASFAGQGVYSGHWSGDIFSKWEDLRYSIRSLINFNMYAMPMMGSDICGFGGNTTVDLCARWQAVGAFYPFSRNHNDQVTIEQDPVALGQIVVTATRFALQKRYTLLPYLYTLFYRSHVYGDTVIRPLFYEFPEDENTYDIDEQFLWGSSLMIIQVLYQNETTIDAYFPKGLWYNAVTGNQTISSGEKINLTIPISEIYLSVRGGSIIPAQTPALTTTEARKNPFAIPVALDEEQKAYGELYWDDGDSLETYDNGFYNLIQFEANNGSFVSKIANKGYQTTMELGSINIIGYGDFPTEVSLNGQVCNPSEFALNTTDSSDKNNKNSIEKNPGVFGINLMKHIMKPDTKKEKIFCHFFSLGPILVIQPLESVSLLLPVTATWN